MHFLSLILFLALATQNCSAEKKPNIKLTDLKKCETGSSEPIPWSFEMNNDKDGYKIVDAEFDLTNHQFTDQLEATFDVDKFDSGDWEENVYNHEENLCDVIKKYIPKAWENLLKHVKPTPMSICNAQQAVFKLEGFEVAKEEIQVPALYGKMRITMKLFDEDDQNILCSVVEMEITEE